MIVIANHTAVCISADVTPSRAMSFSANTYRVMPPMKPSAERPTSGHETAPPCQIFAAYTKPTESAKPDNTIRTSTSSEFQDIDTPGSELPVMYAKTEIGRASCRERV